MRKLNLMMDGVLVAACSLCLLSGMASAELVGHWPLDEGAGDTTADLSTSGTTGMIFNGDTGGMGDGGSVWTNDPARGSVLSFNGSAEGAYVQAGSTPVMDLSNEFTWAFWANHSSENDQPNNIVLGNRYNADAVDFAPRQFIKFTPTKFEWHSEGNGNDNLDYPDLLDSADTWNHHAVVKSGADLTYYLNGTPTSTGVITQPLVDAQPLYFGGDNSASDGENWMGMLDDIRIYDHALSAADVGQLVPEPSSSLLLVCGLGMLMTLRRRK